VFAVIYELGSYIPEDGILHSHRRENLKSYMSILIYDVADVHNCRGTNSCADHFGHAAKLRSKLDIYFQIIRFKL
jgi:hypothetical protein